MSDTTNNKKSFIEIKNEVLEVLQAIYDPEIPVNIYEMGLIYEVEVDPANKVTIVMTLTTPNCPVAESLPQEVEQRVKEIAGVSDVDLTLTFDPPWDMSMLSEAAKLELGFM